MVGQEARVAAEAREVVVEVASTIFYVIRAGVNFSVFFMLVAILYACRTP